MADENTPNEDDVKAEMMRMMQEETGGEGEDGEEDIMAAMAAAVGEDAGEDIGDGNIDEMLEAEMLKAMQTDTGEAASSGGGGASGLMALGGGMMPASAPEGIERLSDVDVFVTVEIGGTQIPIKDIMEWTCDSIVELDPMEEDPVEVLVNGKLFALGEVVVVDDTFGVRIIELVDHSEEASFDNQ